MSSCQSPRFKEGERVWHPERKYVGTVIGTTKMADLFECEDDEIGVRVRVREQDPVVIASPRKLVKFMDMPLKERQRATRASSRRAKKRNKHLTKLKTLHEAYQQSLGLGYRGLRARNPVHRTADGHRVTHCWRCQRDLDNAIDYECVRCGGIVCSCGACFCGTYFRGEPD